MSLVLASSAGRFPGQHSRWEDKAGGHFPFMLVSEMAVGLSNENPTIKMAQPSGYRHVVDAGHDTLAREVVAEIVELSMRKARKLPTLIPNLVGVLPILMDIAIRSFGRRKYPWRIRGLPHVHVSKMGRKIGAEINDPRFAVFSLSIPPNVKAPSLKIDISPVQAQCLHFAGAAISYQLEEIRQHRAVWPGLPSLINKPLNLLDRQKVAAGCPMPKKLDADRG
jgi:hypothetical protein